MRSSPERTTKAATTSLRAYAGRLDRYVPIDSKCPPPRGNERLPPPQSWTPTPQPRGYVAERPAQRSLSGQLASDMETQASSLLTMEAATDPQAVTAFAQETLAGSGWEIDSVRHRVNRVD